MTALRTVAMRTTAIEERPMAAERFERVLQLGVFAGAERAEDVAQWTW